MEALVTGLDPDAVALARDVLSRANPDAQPIARLGLDAAAARALALLLELGASPERADLEELDLIDADGVVVALLDEALGRPPELLATLQRLARWGLIEGLDGRWAVAWSPKTSPVRPSRLLSLAHAGVAPPKATSWYAYAAEGPALEGLILPADSRGQLERLADEDESLVVVRGEAGAGRTAAAKAVAARRGLGTLRLTGRADDARTFAEASALARWWGAMVLLDGGVEGAGEAARRFAEAATPCALIVDLDAPRVELSGGGVPSAVSLRRPGERARAQAWRAALGALGYPAEVEARRLARAYPLGFGDIAGAVREADARVRAEGAALLAWRHLRESLAQHFRRRRPYFVQAVPVRASFEDVVLPPETDAEVRTLVGLCRSYEGVLDEWNLASRLSKGRGIVALLSGPPGTGKTLVAEALAETLARDLLKVDFGTLVSKFVGETGKHIRELFEAVDPLGSVLLFDEVDSLMQRRTEAKSSVDRYANLDTNLLLQHLETFDGVVLLTTNLDAHLDEALRRRISLHVRFALPDAERRAQIWRRLVPPEVPLAADVDFDDLAADTEIAGGHIKNCVVRALNTARARGETPRQRHFHAALVAECRALGMVVRAPARWEDDE